MADERESGKLADMAFNEALSRWVAPDNAAIATNAAMNDGAIERLIDAFENAAKSDEEGMEFWTARDLQRLLGYTEWRNFLNAIEKAKASCVTAGHSVADHFVDTNNMVEIGSGAERPVDDIYLTRYACYLIAQNGDPKKAACSLRPDVLRHTNPPSGDERSRSGGIRSAV